jgi:hypothetical protein
MFGFRLCSGQLSQRTFPLLSVKSVQRTLVIIVRHTEGREAVWCRGRRASVLYSTDVRGGAVRLETCAQ